jgi:ABC-2 type transport system ATP-binding protein
MSHAIIASHLEKSFGQQKSIDSLSFQVKKGSLTAFLGPNGAGKSTAIKLVLGLRRADRGEIRVLGHAPTAKEIKPLIGYTSQDLNYPANLKVHEVLAWVRSHYREPLTLNEAQTRFSLKDIWSRSVGALSGGERRRVGLACAFIGRPQLVILDEPTTGLDLDSRRDLFQYLSDFRDHGGTVLLCTHDLADVQKIADEVLLIEKGKLLFTGTLSDILSRVQLKKVSYRLSGELTEIFTENSDHAVRDLVQSQVGFSDLKIQEATLEEAFHEIRRSFQQPLAGGGA